MTLKDKTVVIDNKIYRYSKIVMLSTNKAENFPFLQNTNGRGNQLYIPTNGYYYTQDYLKDNQFEAKHLYFLSTDKIYEGDWFYSVKYDKIGKYSGHEWLDEWAAYKIIVTTNPECNLPKPSDSFLQVYIDCFNRNEKIDECLVEYNEFISNNGINLNDGYHKGVKITKGEITIRKVKESWGREEVIEYGKKVERFINKDKSTYTEIPKWFIEENL